MRSAARTARSASSSWATGAPNRATMASPMILSTRPPKATMSADETLEAAVDQVLHLLGVEPLGQLRVADEVGEQHGDDPPLLGALAPRAWPHEGQNRAPPVLARARRANQPPSVRRRDARHAGFAGNGTARSRSGSLVSMADVAVPTKGPT